LELPVNEILRLGKPDFPFCLCWANENWTKVWDGGDKKILLQQDYSAEDDLEHIRWLCPVFSDPRYIRIEGKPLFLVYKSGQLPDAKATTATWRDEAHRLGLGELYLCCVESNSTDLVVNPSEHGFDAAVEFQPKLDMMDESLVQRALYRFHLNDNSYRLHPYSEFVKRALARPPVEYLRYRCVAPSWDNSSRHARWPFILKDASPEIYEYWLRETIQRTPANREGDKVIFVNAWNEWAEGCHLEPCQKWGRGYLEATLRAAQSGEAGIAATTETFSDKTRIPDLR
jgi:hypothetical protein